MARSKGVRCSVGMKYLIPLWRKIGILPKGEEFMLEYRKKKYDVAVCDKETITIQQVWSMDTLEKNVIKALERPVSLAQINTVNDGKYKWIDEVIVIDENVLPIF